ALEAVGTILDALQQLGVTPVIREQPLATFARERAALQRAVVTWNGAERHFRVALPPHEAGERVAARLRSLPQAEGEYWNGAAGRVGGVPTGPISLAERRVGSGRERAARRPGAAAPRR